MDELIEKFKLEKEQLIADYEEKIKNLSGDSSSALQTTIDKCEQKLKEMEAMYKAQLEKQRIGYEKKIADLKKRLEEERQKLLGSAGEAQKKLQS